MLAVLTLQYKQFSEDGQELIIQPLTAEEVGKIKDFVMSVDRISSYNEEIENIIKGEKKEDKQQLCLKRKNCSLSRSG